MIIIISISIGLLMIGGLFSACTLFSKQCEKAAKKKLLKQFFPNGEEQKQRVIEKLMALTESKYSEKELLDYYLKMKALQDSQIRNNKDLRVRRFIKHTSPVKLDYFQQVKFFNLFLYAHPIQKHHIEEVKMPIYTRYQNLLNKKVY